MELRTLVVAGCEVGLSETALHLEDPHDLLFVRLALEAPPVATLRGYRLTIIILPLFSSYLQDNAQLMRQRELTN
jgi:hypothetical protein